MTLAPWDDWNVTVLNDVPPYKVEPVCAVPTCMRTTDIEAHHIWRRSFTGTPAAWVRLGDGTKIGNLVGLCHEHHSWVTGGVGGHKAWIRWNPAFRTYEWHEPRVSRDGEEEWAHLGDLAPQPPRDGKKPETLSNSVPHVHVENCPTCGKPKKERPKLPPGEKRPKSKIVFTVPEDEREKGSEVVRTLLDEWKKVRGRWDEKSDYFALVEALAFCVQHSHLIEVDG